MKPYCIEGADRGFFDEGSDDGFLEELQTMVHVNLFQHIFIIYLYYLLEGELSSLALSILLLWLAFLIYSIDPRMYLSFTACEKVSSLHSNAPRHA